MIQGEWNIVKMGNPSHFGTCKRVRFKNILIETTDLVTNNIESVTIMTDFIIDVSDIKLRALIQARAHVKSKRTCF